MPGISPDLFFATIGELRALLTARSVSAVELARAFGQRLEKLGPRYNALALPLTERAIRQARDVDGEIKRGRLRGPLQGIPYGVKDLLSVAGLPTTWGARPFAAQVFDYTATVVNKLQKAGAVLVGKLAMVQLAGGGGYRYAAASLTGPGLNPWDRTRWAGGSSSGSAAAVAAGLVPFALGSETSGSIVTPAAFCGVTGLRPTYGLVSRSGAMALSWTLDKIGALARSADDCGLILAAIAGGDSGDPGSAGKSFYYTPQYARKIGELKIGFAPADFTEWADPPTQPAFEQALGVLRASGATLMESKLPDYPYGAVIRTIITAEGVSAFEALITSGKVDQLADARQIANLKAGLDITARDYLKAMRIRRLIQQEFRKLFSQVDVVVAPARTSTAGKVEDPLDRPSGRPTPKTAGFSALIAASNLAGLPALCLPCGFADNLPVGIQLVGAPFTENMLLAVGRDFQTRTDWHRRRPPATAG